MEATDVIAIAGAGSAVFAGCAAIFAGRAAAATRDLVNDERLRDQRSRLIARGHSSSGKMVVLVYNLGPGVATLKTVRFVRDNGEPIDGPLTFSDSMPVILNRGEYTRVDKEAGLRSVRLDVDYEDAADRRHDNHRVRVTYANEPDLPLS